MLTYRVRKSILRAVLICAAVVLSACQSGEERAEEHYQRALSLLEAGDTARAQVEFRNVFEHNGTHRDARAAFAEMLRDNGNQRGAIRQYLRLVEQYPRDAEGLIAVTELALLSGNREVAWRHGRQATEVAPEDPRIAVIGLYLDYFDALDAEDALASDAVMARAEAALDGAPENVLLQRLVLDGSLRSGDYTRALAQLDTLLANDPDERSFYDTRLAIFVELQQGDEIEALLQDMLTRFPEDEELSATLLRFYLAQGRVQEAMAFLRAQAEIAEDPEMQTELRAALVQLVLQTDGPDAALAEIDAILATEGAPVSFAGQRAMIRFDLGAREEAIAELETLLEGDVPNQEEGVLRVALARMLLATGNEVGARAQVEQVLEADANQTDALRMRAAWLIMEDRSDAAISALRTVLDLSPEDVQAMTLMSQAHARNGNHELAREFLALAVEASGNAPAETVRYVAVLLESERFLAAEELLITALQRSPNDLDLLNTLGQLYIRMGDWDRSEQVEAAMRGMSTAEGDRVANGLQVARMAAQGQLEDALNVLEGLAAAGETSDARTQIAVVRARLSTGDAEGARAYAENLVAENPEEPGFRFTLAAVLTATGAFEEAETLYRALITEQPQEQQIWLGLIRLLNAQGRDDEARVLLESALETLPEALDLLWAQASYLERAGDFEGAIAIYEEMYARAPSAEVIANNLASLLSTYRSDQASLDRAWAVARRLRGRDVPPFQDTYGWLAYQRGEYDEALEHLEPAAAGLPDDPMVQYHLGLTYLALSRPEEALAQLQRAVALAGDDPRPQFANARTEIERLEAAE